MTTISLKWGDALYTFPISPGFRRAALVDYRNRRRWHSRAEARSAVERSVVFFVATDAPGATWRVLL